MNRETGPSGEYELRYVGNSKTEIVKSMDAKYIAFSARIEVHVFKHAKNHMQIFHWFRKSKTSGGY
jgi:hypothetical protein